MRRIGVFGLAMAAALSAVAPAHAAPIVFGPAVPLSITPGFGVGAGFFDPGPGPDVLLTPGALGTKLQVVLNKGDGSFFEPADVTGAGQVERPAIGDIDLDGDADAAIGSTGGVFLLRGNGNGGFATSLVGPATYVTDVAIGDVNGDARPDLVGTLFNAANTTADLLVLLQNADGSFTAVPQGAANAGNAGVGPRAVLLADITNDGRLDVLTGDSNGIVFVLRGDNTGVFPIATRTAFNATTEVEDMLLVDLNRNGLLDVATASGDGGSVNILLGTSPGTFAAPMPIPVGVEAQWIAAADLDGDSLVDLAVTNQPAAMQPGRVSILRGRGDGTFDPATQLAAGGTGTPGLAIADINLDDRPDLLVTATGVAPSVYLNGTEFPPPVVTTGAASAITLDAGTISGTVDADGRRGFWWFEYGKTAAYGNTSPRLALGISPDAQTLATALAGLEAGTTYHYRIVGQTLAGGAAGVVAGADAAFTTLDIVRLTAASFNVKYTLSKAKGTLLVRGTAPSAGAKVVFTLFRNAGRGRLRGVKGYPVTLKPGAFSRRLKVPASVLPGKYTVRVTGTVGDQKLQRQDRAVTLKAPRQGVVRRSFASSVRNGPPAVRLPGRRTQVHATFVFAARPAKGQKITVRWFQPSRRPIPALRKANAARIGTVIVSRSGLPKGRWRCELRVGKKLLAVVRVRIG